MSDIVKIYIDASSVQYHIKDIKDILDYQLNCLGDSSRDEDKVKACKIIIGLVKDNYYNLVSFDFFRFYVVDCFETTSEAYRFTDYLDLFGLQYRTLI